MASDLAYDRFMPFENSHGELQKEHNTFFHSNEDERHKRKSDQICNPDNLVRYRLHTLESKKIYRMKISTTRAELQFERMAKVLNFIGICFLLSSFLLFWIVLKTDNYFYYGPVAFCLLTSFLISLVLRRARAAKAEKWRGETKYFYA